MHIIHGMIADQQLHMGIFLGDDQQTAVHAQVHPTPQDIDQLQRLLNRHIFGYINDESILCEHRVIGNHTIIGIVGNLTVVRSELFRILLRECLQTSCKDTLGQSFFRTFFIVITIVDEEIGVC